METTGTNEDDDIDVLVRLVVVVASFASQQGESGRAAKFLTSLGFDYRAMPGARGISSHLISGAREMMGLPTEGAELVAEPSPTAITEVIDITWDSEGASTPPSQHREADEAHIPMPEDSQNGESEGDSAESDEEAVNEAAEEESVGERLGEEAGKLRAARGPVVSRRSKKQKKRNNKRLKKIRAAEAAAAAAADPTSEDRTPKLEKILTQLQELSAVAVANVVELFDASLEYESIVSEAIRTLPSYELSTFRRKAEEIGLEVKDFEYHRNKAEHFAWRLPIPVLHQSVPPKNIPYVEEKAAFIVSKRKQLNSVDRKRWDPFWNARHHTSAREVVLTWVFIRQQEEQELGNLAAPYTPQRPLPPPPPPRQSDARDQELEAFINSIKWILSKPSPGLHTEKFISAEHTLLRVPEPNTGYSDPPPAYTQTLPSEYSHTLPGESPVEPETSDTLLEAALDGAIEATRKAVAKRNAAKEIGKVQAEIELSSLRIEEDKFFVEQAREELADLRAQRDLADFKTENREMAISTIELELPSLPEGWSAEGDFKAIGTLSQATQRSIEPVGPHFLAHARRARHKRTFSEDDRIQAQQAVKKVEDDDDGDISEPEDPMMLSRDAKDWKGQDHYAVLGLSKYRHKATEEQIKRAHRKKVLRHHPDKKAAAGSTEDDNFFKCIQKATEILLDPVKRRQFDSVDEHADVEPPSKKQAQGNKFYKLWGNVFKAEGRFSRVQPVPKFGDEKSAKEEVEEFYNFFYNFDSWRSFEYQDEDVPDDNESRDQKRHVERKNNNARKKKKAEDNARLRKLLDDCSAADERIKKFRQDANASKNKKKLEKEAAEKKAAEEAKIKKEADEKAAKAAEEAAKVEREQGKKAKEAAKTAVKKNKRVLKGSVKDANYFVAGEPSAAVIDAVLGDIELVQGKVDADEIAALAGKLNGLKVADGIKAVWSDEVKRLVGAGKLKEGDAKSF
ncbi:MAG: hypothetical protein M1818_001360 [Claussenomyces sp. TS43310]|nr:MAG: hypothetical protein M1818_001360 [Claussenomyces sp. TS43310]